MTTTNEITVTAEHILALYAGQDCDAIIWTPLCGVELEWESVVKQIPGAYTILHRNNLDDDHLRFGDNPTRDAAENVAEWVTDDAREYQEWRTRVCT